MGFRSILPNMPMLYSTFKVMVLPEVPEGVHSYESSGWCFSERAVASLGQQLAFFSPMYDLYDCTTRSRIVTCDLGSYDQELQTKAFTASDRQIVKSLCANFLSKRLLVDAIRNTDASKADEILRSLNREQTRVLLNAAIDSYLNTPLHLAVSVNSPRMTALLLSYGASPYIRNQWGDTPSQKLILRRMSAAAKLCLQAQKTRRHVRTVTTLSPAEFWAFDSDPPDASLNLGADDQSQDATTSAIAIDLVVKKGSARITAESARASCDMTAEFANADVVPAAAADVNDAEIGLEKRKRRGVSSF